MSVIAITGVNGFIGRGVAQALISRGYKVRGLARVAVGPGDVVVNPLGPEMDWRGALRGIDTVIHTAGLAHLSRRSSNNSREIYERVNVVGTRLLAEQAAQMKVRRLIYISSVHVLGTSTSQRPPFTVQDIPAPEDEYARSKHLAELELLDCAVKTGLEIIIVRPPLVYGENVSANFSRLVRLVDTGVPLPFASIRNRRSLVALDNLVSVLIKCIEVESASERIFLVSDDHDLSTPELVQKIAHALNKRSPIFPAPLWALRYCGLMLGATSIVDRFIQSLQVDISHTKETLKWVPIQSVDEAIQKAVSSLKSATQ